MKQSVRTNIPIEDWEPLSDIFLPPDESYKLSITYPLSEEYTCQVKSGKKGLGFHGIVNAICRAYHHVYRNDNKYGIWGHDMCDLFLERITVDHNKKTIEISVGS
jgi:hypothetical protein